METKISTQEFAQKVMEGLNIAVKKVVEDARKNNQPLAVSNNGKVKLIYA
jgi:hypothetical protein